MKLHSDIDMSILRKICLAMYKDLEMAEVKVTDGFDFGSSKKDLFTVAFKEKGTNKIIKINDKDLLSIELSRSLKIGELTDFAHKKGYINDAMHNEILIDISNADKQPKLYNKVASKLYNEIVVRQVEYDATSIVMHEGYYPTLNLARDFKIVVDENDVNLTKNDIEFLAEEKHSEVDAHMYAMSRTWNGENIIQGPHLDDALTRTASLFSLIHDEVQEIVHNAQTVRSSIMQYDRYKY